MQTSIKKLFKNHPRTPAHTDTQTHIYSETDWLCVFRLCFLYFAASPLVVYKYFLHAFTLLFIFGTFSYAS